MVHARTAVSRLRRLAASVVTRLLVRARPLLAYTRALDHRRERLLAGTLAVLAGLLVFVVASDLFPYHSSNHDEAVYLQQAELLLDGQFRLDPGSLGDAVRPWFFVDGPDGFYPKYSPLPAALYAVSMALFGEPRLTLAAVAAGNTALVYVLGAMLFDRRVGLLGAAGFAVAPMTVITSAVFLPYAPTTLFTLAFAVLYLRGRRSGRPAAGALAGGAIGVAFFMRPFTALVFALPFVADALRSVLRAARAEGSAVVGVDGRAAVPESVWRHGATAVVGVAFVGLTLAYNARLTGAALTFPYEAFAPLDGPGFGERRILGHAVDYTPGVAVRANAHVVWYLLTRWVPAGALGAALAAVGLVASVRRWDVVAGERTPRLLVAALFLTVPVGNLFFWGNYNVLATASDPTDGLLGQFGPFYHFDLLAPVAVFGAAGVLALWRQSQHALAGCFDPRVARALAVATLAVGLLVAGGVNATLLAGPVDRNAAHTETYEDAYAPFEERTFDDAMVFVPTPYGDWLNHPFQILRNEPGVDGDVVYALDRDPAGDFAAIDATPDRERYRYTYRGEWTPDPADREVVPRLEPLDVRSAASFDGETVVGVPDRVTNARVRVETDEGFAVHAVENPGERVALNWSLDGDAVGLDTVGNTAVGERVSLDAVGEVTVLVRLVQSEGASLTYRQAMSVRTGETGVEVVWPPERTVCPLVDDCGREGTYLPDRPDERFDGVFYESRLES